MTETIETTPPVYEVKAAVDRLTTDIEEFKAAHGAAEPAAGLERKLDQLARRVDQMHLAQNRPDVAAGMPRSAEALEHKAAFFDRYIRKGLETGIGDLEAKALTIGADAEGGYAVPEELDRMIERLLKDASPIRRIANVVEIGSANYRKLVNLTGAAAGWVSETGARTETTAPTFAEVVPPLGELYANPAATQAMLDDAFFNVEDWIAEELAIEFGVQEGAAFVDGNGTDKPKGFLTYPTAATDDAARAFGTLEHVATGVDGGFPATDPGDILIDLIYALRPVYRAGAAFVMNTNLVAEIRKFKDADGDYLWRPGLVDGTPPTLLGYPVIEAEDMPDVAANSLSVAFGNFARGYTITDRMGTRILRDPFSNKPFVHFYATKRTGGAVVNSEAIKLLKFSLV